MTREELEFELKMQARDYINEKLPQVPEIDHQALEDLSTAVDSFKSSLDKVNQKSVTKEQLEELEYELAEYPDIAEMVLDGLKIQSLADIPKAKYMASIQRIREIKNATLDIVNKKIIETEDALNSKRISLPPFYYDLERKDAFEIAVMKIKQVSSKKDRKKNKVRIFLDIYNTEEAEGMCKPFIEWGLEYRMRYINQLDNLIIEYTKYLSKFINEL